MIRRILAQYPAGDPRSSLKAADQAQQQREQGVSDAKVIYNARRDDFLVVTETDKRANW